MEVRVTNGVQEEKERLLPSVESVKSAIREGSRLAFDSIDENLIQLVRESLSLKTEVSNQLHSIMEEQQLTQEQISSILFMHLFVEREKCCQLQKTLESCQLELNLRKHKQHGSAVGLRETQPEKEVLEKRNQELTAKATRLTTEVSELRSENEKNKTELQETSDRASQLLIEKQKLEDEGRKAQRRINKRNDTINSYQQTLNAIFQQLAPYRYELTHPPRNQKKLENFGRPSSDPAIQVHNVHHSPLYHTSSRAPNKPPHDVKLEVTARGDLAVPKRRTTPGKIHLEKKEEQVIGSYSSRRLPNFEPDKIALEKRHSADSETVRMAHLGSGYEKRDYLKVEATGPSRRRHPSSEAAGEVPDSANVQTPRVKNSVLCCQICGEAKFYNIFDLLEHAASCDAFDPEK